MKIVLLLTLVAMATAMKGMVPEPELIPGQYVIRIDEDVYKTKAEVQDFLDSIEKEFQIYSVRINSIGRLRLAFVKGEHENVMKAKNLRGVKYVEQNQVVRLSQCEQQRAPSLWGLDRTDQREAVPYSDPFGSDGEYTWGEHIGSSAVAYVLDTGIDIDHSDFGDRATWGFTAPDIPNDGDQNGHGTHCAGTIGGTTYGLAKNVPLVAVKVLGDSGSGSWQGSIDGINYVVDQHNGRSSPGQMAKTVINMSLGGSGYSPIDDAIEAAVGEGVVVVVAAGNSGADACWYSPAREPTAITVGASDIGDWSASFSNYGICVDIFAPGVSILSTLPNEGTAYYSGTSMACPHVAGVVARYQDSQADAPSPAEVSIMQYSHIVTSY